MRLKVWAKNAKRVQFNPSATPGSHPGRSIRYAERLWGTADTCVDASGTDPTIDSVPWSHVGGQQRQEARSARRRKPPRPRGCFWIPTCRHRGNRRQRGPFLDDGQGGESGAGGIFARRRRDRSRADAWARTRSGLRCTCWRTSLVSRRSRVEISHTPPFLVRRLQQNVQR